MHKTLAIARKEFRQIARDRRTLGILLFVPAFFLLVYGYALSWDVQNIALAVDDRDRSASSRSLVSAFVNSGYFNLVATAGSEAEVDALMNRNRVRLVLVIPEEFGRDLDKGLTAPVQLLLNGDNANTATTVMGYALTIVQTESSKIQARAGGTVATLLRAEPRIWYNPQLRSAIFLVPGLIAYISMITAVVSTALSIVREKERDTIEQVRMAPIGAGAFVVGKTIPYFAVSLVSGLGIVFVAMLLFGMPMRGSWALLVLTLSLVLAGALGLGLLISSVSESQQVAFQMALLVSFLPTFMLSGFVFPISSMPDALQVITHLVPARYFLTALRAIVLKGVGFDVVWPELAALLMFATVVLTLASVRLRRQWA